MPDVQLPGNPNNRYWRLGPRQARMMGVQPHPEWECALVLAEDADPNARLILPNGRDFTAQELSELSNKDGDRAKGWEIWADDPCGRSSWELPDAGPEVMAS